MTAMMSRPAPSPSPAQKVAGNYRKGHIRFHGLDLTIESRRGMRRSGVGRDGKRWAVTMPADYGYLKRTAGADGDHVDAYLGPYRVASRQRAYVIDQVDPDTGDFDEHKVMLGYRDLRDALDAYVRAFSDKRGIDRIGAVADLSLDELKGWLARGNTEAPFVRKGYASGGAVGGGDAWWEAAPLASQAPASQAPASQAPAGGNWWEAAPLADAGAGPQQGPLQLTISPGGGNAAAPDAGGSWLDTAEGLGKAAVSGLGKGVLAIPGIPGTLAELGQGMADSALDASVRALGGTPLTAEEKQRRMDLQRQDGGLGASIPMPPTSQDIIGAAEAVGVPFYTPRTTAEKYVGTVGEFVPTAAVGGLGSAIRYGVVPGLVSEAAGQAAEGSPYEDYARTAGAVVGGLGAGMTKAGVPKRQLSGAMRGQTNAALEAARDLMTDAAGRGINLSWAEALNQVTTGGARRLAEIQDYVERSPKGAPLMQGFYAGRPEAFDRAARATFDTVAPQAPVPTAIGAGAQRAAEGAVQHVRDTINQSTRPLYRAAEGVEIPLPDFGRMLNDPSFRQAVNDVLSHPEIAPTLSHLPVNSVGVVDAAQKLLRARAEAAAAGSEGMDRYLGAIRETARRGAVQEARGVSPEYGQALDTQHAARSRFLEPVEQGALGRIASTSDVTAQTGALFPTNPLAGSAREVREAVRQLSGRDPAAARGLVRQHLERAFNEATQRLQSGPNEWGASKFASIIAGNPQQYRNLEAGVRALPNGNDIWNGFRRFLSVAEASGWRQRAGSQTQPRQLIQREMERGPLVGGAAALGFSPKAWLSAVQDFYREFRAGRNATQLARILTDPEALPTLRRIARATDGKKLQEDAAELISLASQGAREWPSERRPALGR